MRCAGTLGVAGSLLANVLRALDPNFSTNADGPTLLHRDELLSAQAALENTIRRPKANEILGFNAYIMKLAVDRGLVECLIRPSPGHFGLVWRQSVARIQQAFNRVPVVTTAGLLDPATLARKAFVREYDVLTGVLEGRLRPAGRSNEVADFRALRFQPAAVDKLCALLRDEVSRGRASAMLGWLPETILALERAQLLEVQNRKAVRLDALESFRGEFATAKEAAEWLAEPPSHKRSLNLMLKKTCGLPVVSGPNITAFWPRAHMAAQLRPFMKADASIHAIGFESGA